MKQGRLTARSGTRGNGLKLKESRCRSDTRKKLFVVKVVRQ